MLAFSIGGYFVSMIKLFIHFVGKHYLQTAEKDSVCPCSMWNVSCCFWPTWYGITICPRQLPRDSQSKRSFSHTFWPVTSTAAARRHPDRSACTGCQVFSALAPLLLCNRKEARPEKFTFTSTLSLCQMFYFFFSCSLSTCAATPVQCRENDEPLIAVVKHGDDLSSFNTCAPPLSPGRWEPAL